MEATPAMGPVKSQSVKDRSYVLRDSVGMIPQPAKEILVAGRYCEFII